MMYAGDEDYGDEITSGLWECYEPEHSFEPDEMDVADLEAEEEDAAAAIEAEEEFIESMLDNPAGRCPPRE